MDEPKIIYEDEDLLVLNKPAGLLTHGTKDGGASLADWLTKNRPGLIDVGPDKTRPGIIHRLDRETSGVIIVAKNNPAFEFLKKQFAHRAVQKTYLAIIVGRPQQKQGEIRAAIGRSKKDARRRISGRGASGKTRDAITRYQVLEDFKDFSLLKVEPITGRTHQIRVHFKALNHPIAGDNLYAPKAVRPPDLKRLALHAASLELKSPQGTQVKFEAELPADLQTVLNNLRVL